MDIDIKTIAEQSIRKAFKRRNFGSFRREVIKHNSYRSKKFVYEFAKSLYEQPQYQNNYKLNVQIVGDDGEKESGEWLLDFCITGINKIEEGRAITDMNMNIVWAGESEYHTSLKGLSEDFAKLLVVKSQNYIYLNGMNQKTIDGRDEYIERRLNTAAEVLKRSSLSFEKFYYVFWPSPEKGKNGLDSLWDNYDTDTEIGDLIKAYEISNDYSYHEI